jgi:alpha-mannosidase
MLESLRRARAVANVSHEIPKVSVGRSVLDFFEQIEEETDHGKKLNTWTGELVSFFFFLAASKLAWNYG